MKRFLSFLGWAVVTAAVVFAALCFFPYFNIANIQVNGIESLSEEQVIAICGLDGTHNLLAYNTVKADNELRKNNYVKDAGFEKLLPNTLVINVEEYKVRGYIPYMNAYLYIDDEGRVLDSRPDMAKQLPVVTGLKFDSFTIGEVLKTDNPNTYIAVKEMSSYFDNYEMLDNVIKVDVSDTENIHLYVDKIDVKFGGFDNANEKIMTLNEILKQMDTSVAGVLDLTVPTPTFKYMS